MAGELTERRRGDVASHHDHQAAWTTFYESDARLPHERSRDPLQLVWSYRAPAVVTSPQLT